MGQRHQTQPSTAESGWAEPQQWAPEPPLPQSAWGDPERDGREQEEPLETFAIDAALLAIAAGDRTRFAELFKHFAPRVTGYLIEGGLPAPDAEDLAIAAMFEIWRTAAEFDPAAHTGSAWFFQRVRGVTQRKGGPLPAGGRP